jgi:AraC family transcriptional regulator of adaptative response/methylated-DNA-[protein]-cysteine methyltransferase
MSRTPSRIENNTVLKASRLDTPLGPMLAISDEQALYLLEFVDCRGLEKEVERMRQKTKSVIIPGCTKPSSLVEDELNRYFEGKLSVFKTPISFLGSPFQKKDRKPA